MVDYEFEIYRVELDGSNTVVEHSLVSKPKNYVIERAKWFERMYKNHGIPRKFFAIMKGEKVYEGK